MSLGFLVRVATSIVDTVVPPPLVTKAVFPSGVIATAVGPRRRGCRWGSSSRSLHRSSTPNRCRSWRRRRSRSPPPRLDALIRALAGRAARGGATAAIPTSVATPIMTLAAPGQASADPPAFRAPLEARARAHHRAGERGRDASRPATKPTRGAQAPSRPSRYLLECDAAALIGTERCATIGHGRGGSSGRQRPALARGAHLAGAWIARGHPRSSMTSRGGSSWSIP